MLLPAKLQFSVCHITFSYHTWSNFFFFISKWHLTSNVGNLLAWVWYKIYSSLDGCFWTLSSLPLVTSAFTYASSIIKRTWKTVATRSTWLRLLLSIPKKYNHWYHKMYVWAIPAKSSSYPAITFRYYWMSSKYPLNSLESSAIENTPGYISSLGLIHCWAIKVTTVIQRTFTNVQHLFHTF